ncbi:effector-associated constant component EACC1 [Cellulomonas sp. ICMP 17802]|uniref:effector-associated constant component EACC1 n=1 Tax=Cellulomonas sp. ICMP 17802 TaxID=3239199 RepID=UPI00351B52B7
MTGVTVRLVAPAPDELERGALRLRDELLVLPVDDVRPVTRGDAPAGTRGPSVAEVGALLVSLGPTVQLLQSVVRSITAWLQRDRSVSAVTVTIDDDTIELSAATSEQQQRLVDAWLARHGGDGP